MSMQIQKASYLKTRSRQRKVSYTKILGETPPIQLYWNQSSSSIHLGWK